MHPTLLQNVLWVSGPCCQLIVAAAMIHRRAVRQLPVFWSYSVFHVLLATGTYSASRISYRTYFYIYWAAEVVDMFLTLFVIQELFSVTFSPYGAIRSLGRMLFQSVALIMMLLSVVLARIGTLQHSMKPLIERLIAVERSVHVFEIGVLIALLVASRLLGIVWNRLVFGIAIGIGFTLAGEAIAAGMRAFLGAAGNQLYVWLEPISACTAPVIWAYYAISADPVLQPLSATADGPSQLGEWNRALEHFF